MSSKNFEDLRTLFESLSADERKSFTAIVKDSVRANSFSLCELVAEKAQDGIKCPHCRCTDPNGIVKFGIRRNVQWYKCKTCGRTFSGVTGTLWSCTKKEFYVWKRYVKSMMEGQSIRKAAYICGINRNTAFAWRHKILDALAKYHDSQDRMKGIVEADDTFFNVSYKGSKPDGRQAHRRGEKSTKRGTSKEKVCVSCAVDRNGQRYSKVSALGRPTAKALREVFRNQFSKEAVVCTDNDKAYVKYVKRRKLEHIRVPNGIKKLGVYHVQNINAYHSRLKAFIARFKGVATKYLNNYLVWNNLIQEGARSRVDLLKLAVKALTFSRWLDISCRPAIPI